ncbi:hypothetical protein SFC88_22820 [Nocardioides sp. HM23]|uniref:hypothetical protein n=1 Tax=Nocardioides bizhenqiangii TaxID=3095076 RepID=UPI002ACAC913|nr:hypothetical protein [Nocardioides sp. HM23]MDZ5623677.1 hypothetical protein [Nocardioides sp. HM23]
MAPEPNRLAWMQPVLLDEVARGTEFDGLVGRHVVGIAESSDASLPYVTVAIDDHDGIEVVMVCQRGGRDLDHVLIIDSSGGTSTQGPLPSAGSLDQWASKTVHVLLSYFSGPGRNRPGEGDRAEQAAADRPVAGPGARVHTAESPTYREFATRSASPSIDSYVVGQVVHRTEPPGGRIEIWSALVDRSLGQDAVNPIHTSHAAAAFDRNGRLVAIYTVETSTLHDEVFAVVYDGSPARQYQDARNDVLGPEGFERAAVPVLCRLMDDGN